MHVCMHGFMCVCMYACLYVLSSSRRDLAIRRGAEARGGYPEKYAKSTPQAPKCLKPSYTIRRGFRGSRARRRDSKCARNEDLATSFARSELFSSRSRDPSRRGGARRLPGKVSQI